MDDIKNPVGLGAKAVNDPADVKMVQKMLNHHIYELELQPLRVSGKIDQATVTALGKFQKLVAKTSVTTLAEPGSKTIKALNQSPDKARLREQPLYVFKLRGKEVEMTEEDYKKAVAEACKTLKPICVAQLSHYRTIEDHAQFYINAATGASGLAEALVIWSSSVIANIPPPSFSGGPRAYGALKKAQKAVSGQNLKAAPEAIRKAQVELDAYAAEVQAYGNKVCGGAKSMQVGLEFTRDVSFDVAAEIGTAVLMMRGTSKTAAKATTGAVFGALKSSANQVGRAIAKYPDTPGERAATILVDTILGGVKGGISGKYIGKLGDSVAAKIATKPPLSFVDKKVGGALVVKFFQGAGKQSIDEAFGAIVKALGDVAKVSVIKGKKIDVEKYVTKALTDAAFKIATAGLVKNLDGATGKAGSLLATQAGKQAKNASVLKKMRLGKDSYFLKLKPNEQSKVMQDIVKTALKDPGNKGVKSAWATTIAKLNGSESSDKIASAFVDHALANEAFLQEAGREIEKAKGKYAKAK